MKTQNNISNVTLSENGTGGSDDFLTHSFNAILSQSSVGYFIMNTSFEILFLNEEASRIIEMSYGTHYQPGDNFLLLAPDYRKEALSRVLAKVKRGETVSFEVNFLKPTFKKIYSDCSYSPIKNNCHEVIGICVCVKDITDKKELQESESKRLVAEEKYLESLQLFEQFMENSPLRAWITDADGIVHYMNPLHREFVGMDDNYRGKNLHQIFPSEVAAKYARDDQAIIEAGKTVEAVQKAKNCSGTLGIYRVFKFPILINNKRMIAGWAIEITPQVQLQKKLLRQERKNKTAIIRSIIETQEKERRQLSVELHDNVNQILSSCKLMLEVAREKRDNQAELIEKTFESLKEVIVEIRNISHNLNPSAIEDFGLIEAITEMTERINISGKIFIEFDHFRYRNSGLSSESRITIYRIIQEGLNNIVKHAGATNVWITLYSNEAQILVTIRDNGVGFNLNDTKKGLGLRNILHRAEYHHGKVKINTSPGKGCTLKILLQVPTR